MNLLFQRLSQYLLRRPKSWWRSVAAQIWFLGGRSWVPVLPTYLDAEPTNHCNQKCPGCATGDGTMTRAQGMMKPEVFERVMAEMGHSLNFSDLYCMGESFLNKNIYRYIGAARDAGIFTKIDTNGILLDPEKLLDSGLRQINFHISGTTQDIHETYRRGGDLTNIFGNIRKLVEARKKRPDSNLQIRFGMIVFKQNEHQVDEFYSLAREFEVDEAYLIAGKIPNSNMDTMAPMLTTIEDLQVYDDRELEQGRLVRRNRSKCSWPWHGMSVSWNGDVHPCCHDYYDDHKVGNIMEQSVEEIWNGPELRRFRQRLLDGDDIPMCRECPGYGVGTAINNLTKKPVPHGAARALN